MVKYLLIFAYFALAAHLLDAFRHYWREDEILSAAWNLAWGVAVLLIGLAVCLDAL